MSNIVDWASGTRKAPATPWKARKMTISVSEVAIAHSSDATVKARTDQMKSGLRPTRSDSQPVIGIAIAEATI